MTLEPSCHTDIHGHTSNLGFHWLACSSDMPIIIIALLVCTVTIQLEGAQHLVISFCSARSTEHESGSRPHVSRVMGTIRCNAIVYNHT